MTKKPTSVRISEEAKRLLALLAQEQGITQAAVIELLIREGAKKKGIK